ncbi:IPTL-CTERM sorting domain-containing protein [Ottowia sp. SB7-C50]|uniref:IPTL-CTERM sorting domain-containing protein n=1 Tax=Ottowia sp. SB7-C50 TaxID=3081231 RepID=UPI002955DF79|nr:IPTL-CTERM sorting domain-containing protein [Ottowia sp. SB7-C50]WOP15446.1 IPTL-CTERM sorting domain-containing protein [Ottowia sp. SB7-C50]
MTWPAVASFAVGSPVTYTVAFSMPAGSVNIRSNITGDNELPSMLANNADATTVGSPPAPAPVPTLDVWALLALALLMFGGAARRQRRA